jgi:uncharacterized membrane protein YphA (DoxX/SURF4 family)
MNLRCILRTVTRIAIGLLFIFSGYVKAIDPIGSEIKFEEYFEAFGMSFLESGALIFGILLALAELMIGLCFFFGLKMKLASLGAILFMAFFTVLTLILAITNAVQDCGCFGDAIKLTNWQTFYKNLIIDPFVIYAFIERKNFRQIFNLKTEWIIAAGLLFCSAGISFYAYRHLPLIDFMAYKTGVNIPDGMIIPEGAPADIYEDGIYIYEKDGKKESFTLENLPDDTWKFVEAPTPKLIKKGYVPPTQDFSITPLEGGESIQDEVFAKGGYLIFVTSADIGKAKSTKSNLLNDIYKYSSGNNINFMMLAHGSMEELKNFTQKNNAEYPVYSSDATVLKSMVRSNPGVMLLKDNVILKKWNANDIPSVDELKKLLAKDPKDVISDNYTNLTTGLLACIVLILFVLFSIKSLRGKVN